MSGQKEMPQFSGKEITHFSGFENLSGDLVSVVVEFLQEEAIGYRSKWVGGKFSEGMKVASKVVGEVFRGEMGDDVLGGIVSNFESIKDENKIGRKVNKILKNGFKKRAEGVKNREYTLNTIGKEDLFDLGIDPSKLSEAKWELKNEKTTPTLDKSINLVRELAFRRVLVKEISIRYMDNLLNPKSYGKEDKEDLLDPKPYGKEDKEDLLDPKPYGKEDLERILDSSKIQGVLIRGIVMSQISMSGGRKIDPRFILPNDFETVIDLVNKKSIDRNHFEMIGKELGEHLKFSNDQEGVVSSAYADFGVQVVETLGFWEKSVVRREKGVDSPEYWRKFSAFFHKFPIAPLSPDLQFVVSAEKIPEAIKEGLPHLWMSAVQIDGKAIPSAEDVVRTMEILGIDAWNTTEDGIRLLSAEKSWKKYTKLSGENPKKITNALDKIRGLEDAAAYDTGGERMNIILPFNVRSLSEQIGKIKRRLTFYNRKINEHEEYKKILSEIGDGEPDFSRESVFNIFVDSIQTQMKKRETSLRKSLTLRGKGLDKMGWHVISPEGLYLSDAHYNLVNMDEEIQRVESLLTVAENSKYSLPEFIVNNLENTLECLNEWSKTGRAPIRRISYVSKELVSKEPKYSRIGRWYVRSISIHLKKLREQKQVLFELKKASKDVLDMKALLNNDKDGGQSREILLTEERMSEWKQEVREMKVIVSSDYMPKSLEMFEKDKNTIKEARELISIYGKGSKRVKSIIPDKASLVAGIDERPEKVGKESRHKRFMDMLWEIKENSLLPWDYEGEISLVRFMKTLQSRLVTMDAYINLPALTGELLSKEEEKDRYVRVIEKDSAIESTLRLKESILFLQEQESEAKTELMEEMEKSGLAIDEDLLK